VIVTRCSHGFQDPGHKTPSQGFKILIRVQGYIQDCDVVQRSASVMSELTQQSGSLTRLVSDLGQARQKYIRTIHFYVAYVRGVYLDQVSMKYSLIRLQQVKIWNKDNLK
jgi:hypothetical protein